MSRAKNPRLWPLGLLATGYWLLATWSLADTPKLAKTYDVPYRLSRTNHILVRAKINGKGPFNLIVDTGAPALFLTQGVGKQFGLKEDANGWSTLDGFELEGGVVLNKLKARVDEIFQIEGMNGLGVEGVEVHGLLGYNVLARFRIEYDFTRDKMTWTPLNYEPPLPVRIGKGGAPAGLNTMGSVLKVAGALMGRKPTQEDQPRGFLGIEVADADKVVEVHFVVEKGPAAAGGVKAGDRVTQFQGKSVRSAAELRKLAGAVREGDEVRLTVRRGDGTEQLTFKAGKGL